MLCPQSLGASILYRFFNRTYFYAGNPSREERISGGTVPLRSTSRHLWSSVVIFLLLLGCIHSSGLPLDLNLLNPGTSFLHPFQQTKQGKRMVQSWLESFSNMFDPQSLGASTFYTPFLRNTHFNAENPSREARISGGAESLELTSRHLYSSNLIVYLYLALLIVPKCFWTEIFYILERPFFASLLAI